METRLARKNNSEAKQLGAYYTDVPIADFLVSWAIRCPYDTVLDPSFGDGVFLYSSCNRIQQLDGDPSESVFGVELDELAYAHTIDYLYHQFGIDKAKLACRDFFELEPGSLSVDAVIGNPPFIRYQRFAGDVRQLALKRAASQGVNISELTSSWAPFLVHSVSMLKNGGRLAMVIPYEIAYATYARPILQYLADTFGKVTFLTFKQKLFPDLNENTLLLLAQDKGSNSSEFTWRDLNSSADLAKLSVGELEASELSSTLAQNAICSGEERLIEYALPSDIRKLYRELKVHFDVRKLSHIAHVGIGYVTGENSYFHLNPDEVKQWGIPDHFLKPAVCRGRVLTGLQFTKADWIDGLKTGDAAYLLYIDRDSEIPNSVYYYLEHGEHKGVPLKFKCRTRTPWYRVPHVRVPDLFLTYMSNLTPKLIANAAQVVAPNSLHVVRIRNGQVLNGNQLAALWQNSLTLLSCEIEGHALGGGLLKLEPGEAKNVLVPVPQGVLDSITGLLPDTDSLLREMNLQGSTAFFDEIVLMDGLGLTKRECDGLRNAVNLLMSRRRDGGSKRFRAA